MGLVEEKDVKSDSESLGDLFEILSCKTSVDHPLCHDCAIGVLETISRMLDEVFQEKKETSYMGLQHRLATLKQEEDSFLLQLEETKEKINEQETLSVELDKELQNYQIEHHQLLEMQKEMEIKENVFWRDFVFKRREEISMAKAQRSQEHVYRKTLSHLEFLKNANVYNDMFHIWYDGEFATMNGLRLGQGLTSQFGGSSDASSYVVDWIEFNASLGYTVLLLHVLAKKCQFSFDGFKLHPLGSTSRIEKITSEETVTYDLFFVPETGLRFFWYRKFNNAMVSFLSCLKQLVEHLESIDPLFRIPHKISKDKIGSLSIKYHYGQEDSWSKALKYFLTNLKWCLAYVTVNK